MASFLDTRSPNAFGGLAQGGWSILIANVAAFASGTAADLLGLLIFRCALLRLPARMKVSQFLIESSGQLNGAAITRMTHMVVGLNFISLYS